MNEKPNIVESVSRFRSPIVIVDLTYPGVLIPHQMQELAQGTKLTLDLFQTPGLRWDPQWGSFQFGNRLSRGHVPVGAVLLALDVATGEVLTAEKVH